MIRSPLSRTARQPLPGDCPVTWALIIANSLTFLLAYVGVGLLDGELVFTTSSFVQRPWTALTYPVIAGGQIFWILLSAYVLWLFGGSLERAWGPRQYGAFLTLVTIAPALGLWVGSVLTERGTVLFGLGLPLAAIIVTWTSINPSELLLAYFVIPIQARWLGVIVLVLTALSFPFALGIFALAGPAVGLWFLRLGRYGQLLPRRARSPARATRVREGERFTLNPIAALRRWRQRRRFRRLVRTLDPDEHPDQTVH